eukprot:3425128-Pleurochrysis_carterae.AAC.1
MPLLCTGAAACIGVCGQHGEAKAGGRNELDRGRGVHKFLVAIDVWCGVDESFATVKRTIRRRSEGCG